tara:strand:- start:20 stop:214 length:195 start_codon:yes stop_codon:yes gene_type:complete
LISEGEKKEPCSESRAEQIREEHILQEIVYNIRNRKKENNKKEFLALQDSHRVLYNIFVFILYL